MRVELDGHLVEVGGALAEVVRRLVAYAPVLATYERWEARIDVAGKSVRVRPLVPLPAVPGNTLQ